jgi:hypothetical protein
MESGTHKALFEGVVTFEGTMQALRAEKRVKGVGVGCRLVPTPRELSSTCALALSFARSDVVTVGAVLQADGWRVEAAYLYPPDGGEPQPWEP